MAGVRHCQFLAESHLAESFSIWLKGKVIWLKVFLLYLAERLKG
jgi:hypothetical protein